MKELIKKRGEIKMEISKLNDKIIYTNREIIQRSNPIIKVMQDVESKVIESKEFENYRYIGCLGIEPVRGIWNLNDVKIKQGFLKIHSGKSYCGGYSRWIIKIPLKYFEMTLEQIKEDHKEWSISEIKCRISKYKKRERKSKLKEIERLKKEIQDEY